ncbi:NADPH--cytochrome P450 reductase-like protein [Mollisia scopiformis]|uniref:Bifunctional cytochrome P450/NADPH--P450 reductase n=1 Tax=Mollisia scopiformis TaxID=149040 RepID=A0A194X7X7_MOLSC|nr:NADPH--cytochrome P450 reductase-like protein [Mollisia scopiformis]KUJ15912.1 NADPH--cytochrome P450 reductase-like protein [Mollisia scopiformis]
MTEPVPGPKGLPFVGNMFDLVDEEAPLRALEHLAELYGPIYKLQRKGTRVLVVSSIAMAEELFDETRFRKMPPSALAKDSEKPAGLFTAASDDPDWGEAHRILVPAFGSMAIEAMYPEMQDIGNQLVLKWARMGPNTPISVTDDFTRLTLDTIALCAMDFRFNSFYTEQMHPFVNAMVGMLTESGNRMARPAIVTSMMRKTNAKFNEDQEYMFNISQELVRHRRENPTKKRDLLNAMINGTDPNSGSTMRDDLIIANIITFLIAGHETTSGLLSFAFLNMLQNPQAYYAAQREVDEVIGRDPVTVDKLSKLEYLNGVLRETLRLTPTAPIISKQLVAGCTGSRATLGNGKYAVEPTDKLMVLIGAMQRDPSVYGEDANEFRPERMMGESFKNLPSAAWKPFGNGVRACIGRAFAWQEALMVTAMLLQNFDFQLDDPSYKLRIKQTLTIKPANLKMRATIRHKMEAVDLERSLRGVLSMSPRPSTSTHRSTTPTCPGGEKPMTVLYGSNTGTCTDFAQRLASNAASHGFKATVMEMDAGVCHIPKSQPVIVITASYEGQPPDNAKKFISWLEHAPSDSLNGVQYAVFGCGHRDWTSTFQRIPTLVDTCMEKCGAQRLVQRGVSDASQGNMATDFDEWMDQHLWPALGSTGLVSTSDTKTTADADFDISTQSGITSFRQDVQNATVLEARVLTAPGEPQKRHLEVELPENMNYECGDYLAVLPVNSEENVRRVMSRFILPWDSTIVIKGHNFGFLPPNTPLSIRDILAGHVELFEPASKQILQVCASSTPDAELKSQLRTLISDPSTYTTEVLTKRLSLLSLLEQNPSITLSFPAYLQSLTPLKVRYYSISSSPLSSPQKCTLTYNILSSPSLSSPTTVYNGVTGTYLSTLRPGDQIKVSVRPSTKALFHLPLNVAETPLLMFCAGTGLAPFRGFVQQRAMMAPSRKLAKAVLFVGCRSEEKDRLYKEEFDEWMKQGVVDVRYAFSREEEKSEGCRYVQDRMVRDRDVLVGLWDAGARVYVCGGREFVKGVGEAARGIVREELGARGVSVSGEELKRTFREKIADRCATDVFG